MAGVKGLMKDTAIYGVSSIIGRFLNWLLVPLYTIMFPVADYGVVTLVYSSLPSPWSFSHTALRPDSSASPTTNAGKTPSKSTPHASYRWR